MTDRTTESLLTDLEAKAQAAIKGEPLIRGAWDLDIFHDAANPTAVLRLLAHIEEQRRGLESLETMRGLSLKEQATFLWALCRYSGNPESCALNLMRDIGECPFEQDCEAIEQWAWLPILEKRIPPETNR